MSLLAVIAGAARRRAAPVSDFPVVEGVVATAYEADNPQIVTLPSGIASGDLLVLVYLCYSARAVTVSGWTELAYDDGNSTTMGVWYKYAGASESETVSVSHAAGTDRAAAVAYRISGHLASQPPLASAIFGADEGTGGSIDPPLLDPDDGVKNYLWIAATAGRGSRVYTAPADYENLAQASTSGGSAATNCGAAAAQRTLSASSENPDAFTATGSANRSKAITLAIRPA